LLTIIGCAVSYQASKGCHIENTAVSWRLSKHMPEPLSETAGEQEEKVINRDVVKELYILA